MDRSWTRGTKPTTSSNGLIVCSHPCGVQAYGYDDDTLRQLCGVTLLPDVKQATCFYLE